MSVANDEVRFIASDGRQIALPLPESLGGLESKREALGRVCDAISAEWLKRSDKKGRKERKTDLERACYQVIVRCLEGDGLARRELESPRRARI